ncbi:MarR family winged helix-turn-helix transcriptional regulator [Hoeflea sp.]
MAARAMTRRYDAQLRRFGVSVVQFSVLMVLRQKRDEPVSHMARRIAMDRTTMIRNLELLMRKGLVSSAPATKGNGRNFKLTQEGERLAEELVPHWQEAQREVRALLDPPQADSLLSALRTLTAG